jgi:hypothetical protein
MLCPLVRWQLSSALDDRREPPPRAATHAARCARCQAYAHDLVTLHGRLSAGAMRAAPAVRSPRRVPHRLLAGGALAVAGVAVLFYLVGPPSDVVRPREGAVAVVDPPSEAVRSPVAPAPSASARVVDRLSVVFTAPTAFRSELDALADDGRRGALAILDLGGVR